MNAIGVMALIKAPRLIDVRRPDRRRKQETAEPAGESEQRLRHLHVGCTGRQMA